MNNDEKLEVITCNKLRNLSKHILPIYYHHSLEFFNWFLEHILIDIMTIIGSSFHVFTHYRMSCLYCKMYVIIWSIYTYIISSECISSDFPPLYLFFILFFSFYKRYNSIIKLWKKGKKNTPRCIIIENEN